MCRLGGLAMAAYRLLAARICGGVSNFVCIMLQAKPQRSRVVRCMRGCAGRALDFLEKTCQVEGRTPAVLLLFLGLATTAYGLYHVGVIGLCPVGDVTMPQVHAGQTLFVACLIFFAASCWSDPGVITPQTARQHSRLFPCDGVLFSPRACPACALSKPARSKHCRYCDCCVSRMDHHCVWINNCVGLLNMRWFLLFLLSTAAVCAYASRVALRVIRADMARKGPWAILDAGTLRPALAADGWRPLAHFVAGRYPIPAGLCFFLGAAAAIAGGFLAYEVALVSAGTTMNERGKWKDIKKALGRQAAFDSARGSGVDLCPANAYDEGFVKSWSQVCFPRRALRRACEEAKHE